MLIFWLVFLIVFFGTLIVIWIIHSSNISNARKNQENINYKANLELKNSNFKISKKIYLNDYITLNEENKFKKFIAFDNEDKKICFIDYQKGSLLIVNFDEILNYEIYENGSTETVGGQIGGFWSGIFGAETNGMCKDLKLIIRLKRYDTSQIVYEIVSNTLFNLGINKSSQPYRKYISKLQEVVSFLEVIKNENNQTKQ